MAASVFGRFFGGVSTEYVDTIPLLPFGQWLLPVGIFLLMMGVYVETKRRMMLFCLYRYGTVLHWWKRHFLKGLAAGAGMGVFCLFLGLLCDLLQGKGRVLHLEQIAGIGMLWLLHCVSMAALFLLLDLFTDSRWIPGGVLLLEGVTFITGCHEPAISGGMYGMWGMYVRSCLYVHDGFSPEIVGCVEAVMVVSVFFMGVVYLKRTTGQERKI